LLLNLIEQVQLIDKIISNEHVFSDPGAMNRMRNVCLYVISTLLSMVASPLFVRVEYRMAANFSF